MQRFSDQSCGEVFMSKPGPGNLFNLTSLGKPKKAVILVGDPQVSRSVLGDRTNNSAGNGAYGNKPAILHVAEPVSCGNPDPPATVLKKRVRDVSVESAVSFRAARIGNRNLFSVPSV